MLIVHLSTTRLAGAPIRLVRALQREGTHEVRLVDRERWGQYEHDLVHEEGPEEAAALCERADVIHLHNYLDYGSRDFAPVDLDALRRRGTRFVRHFHSTPETVAARMGVRVQDVLDCPIPSLVIPHYPERYYPRARVVPNVVAAADPLFAPGAAADGVAFTPSLPTSAWAERWNTKGAPETLALLRRVAARTGCTVRHVEGRPLAEAIAAKRSALVVVDDLVTGSYHLSGLEGLCLARPVLCFLDDRIQRVLRVVAGADELPFVNVRLEEAEGPLVHLLGDRVGALALGAAGRAWLEARWSEREVVARFLEVYADPERVERQPELRLDASSRFAAVVLPDLAWQARRRAALAARPAPTRALERGRAAYRRLPLPLRTRLRRLLGRPVLDA